MVLESSVHFVHRQSYGMGNWKRILLIMDMKRAEMKGIKKSPAAMLGIIWFFNSKINTRISLQKKWKL